AATGMAAYRQSLGRRDGNVRARMPHGRAEMAVHGVMARMTTKGPQEMTVRARHGVVADLASRRHPFLLITSKRSMQAALRRAKARTKPERPGLHDLHVVAELLPLAVLARSAFYVRTEVLVVFLRQLSLDVFHYAVLPP